MRPEYGKKSPRGPSHSFGNLKIAICLVGYANDRLIDQRFPSAPTPMIAAWLVARSGNSMAVSWYVVVAAVISFVCVLLVKETFREPIDR
ncbi:hypothetical protein [Mycobacterium tuberculosis]|uniref:hypothetical protein n=1 Tax=Mycobacterium tuberculosis TaxID=1773 RepID=UPI0028752286|nr:hypothetical protein [Mycobacterium tuberculosis]MDS0434974.1 hypothetical protein [Mycobacterium tuberculosis]